MDGIYALKEGREMIYIAILSPLKEPLVCYQILKVCLRTKV